LVHVINRLIFQKNKLLIGRICVTGVGLLFLIFYIAGWYYPSLRFFCSILLGGFIGGFTNSVAIRMLFERYWYLPGSGVLLKKRENIIQSLSKTVEKHIINPDLLEQKLREAMAKINVDNVTNSLNAVIDEFRDDLLQYLNSNDTYNKIVKILEKDLGLGGKIINSTGIKDYNVLAYDILDQLDSRIEKFKVSESMVNDVIDKFGSLEDFLFKENNSLVKKHYGSDKSLAFLILNRLNIRQIVEEKLSQYPAEKIRDIIEDSTKEHLGWLEVFGVILGIIFTAIFLFIQ